MLIIGERINSSREKIAQAIEMRNSHFLQQEAVGQVEAGAAYIDVNAGAFLEEEVEYLKWLVKIVQEAIDRPLCLDSVNPEALSAALKLHKGKAIINSITAEKARYKAVLPLVKEYNCGVVALCIDGSGVPSSAEGRTDVASRIIESLTAEKIALDDIYIDPLVQPISTDFNSAMVALQSIKQIMAAYPGVHTICGVSNISFGLPHRKQINQVFIVMAMAMGLDTAILDPGDKRLMANILTSQTLLGRDEYCLNYINACREGRLD